jgi:hypothetical protein
MSQHLRNKIINKGDYETFRIVLNDSKLINNPRYVSQSFKLSLSYVEGVIKEFSQTGCIIMQSKINFKTI